MKLHDKIKEEELMDVQHLLKSINGRRFLWRLISHCGVYHDINTDDNFSIARKIGQQSIGKWLLQVLGDADSEKLFSMMREAEARTKEHQIIAKREVDEPKEKTVEFSLDSFLS